MTTFDEAALLEAARSAQRQAYAPYSKFRVGAALLVADGRVFAGANVENAAYPATICAERVALPAAIVAGARAFTAIAVVGDGDGPCTPCGMCRQVLFEFAPDLVVVAAGSDGSVTRFVLGPDLLPAGFGPDRLLPDW
ncbi:MAG: cytidine deaminase [Actinomycetota bacterium]|jgi:cytidine deaminase|nr:cytidine deaminase [Actinomycetota bacterium]